jgi:hypothetical protein
MGALLGAMAAVVLVRLLAARLEAKSYLGVPALLFAMSYGMAAALEAFIPLFQATPLPGATGGFTSRLSHGLEQFDASSLLPLPRLALLLFPPAGFFAVAALREEGWGHDRWVVVAAAGFAVAVAVEVAAAGAGYPIRAGAVLVHGGAVAVGAWAAAALLPSLSAAVRGRRRVAALVVSYLALLALWSWRPFLPLVAPGELLAQLAPERLVPLTAHAERFDLYSAVDIMRQFALLLPLGGLLAAWPLRLRGWQTGPVPGIVAAVVLEAGQIAVAARTFDITDALVGSAGVIIGWAVVRRAGYRVRGALLSTPPRSAG